MCHFNFPFYCFVFPNSNLLLYFFNFSLQYRQKASSSTALVRTTVCHCLPVHFVRMQTAAHCHILQPPTSPLHPRQTPSTLRPKKVKRSLSPVQCRTRSRHHGWSGTERTQNCFLVSGYRLAAMTFYAFSLVSKSTPKFNLVQSRNCGWWQATTTTNANICKLICPLPFRFRNLLPLPTHFCWPLTGLNFLLQYKSLSPLQCIGQNCFGHHIVCVWLAPWRAKSPHKPIPATQPTQPPLPTNDTFRPNEIKPNQRPSFVFAKPN